MIHLQQELGKAWVCLPLASGFALGKSLGEGKPRLSLALVGGIYHTLSDLVRLKNFRDVYRYVYPSGVEFTFHRPHVASSRLDRFYISSELLHCVNLVQHVASLSD